MRMHNKTHPGWLGCVLLLVEGRMNVIYPLILINIILQIKSDVNILLRYSLSVYHMLWSHPLNQIAGYQVGRSIYWHRHHFTY